MSSTPHTDALKAVVEAADWKVERIVTPAGPESTRYSPNAMRRNDWTPQDRVEWQVTATLNGVDVLDTLGVWASRADRKKDAEARAEELRAEILATPEWAIEDERSLYPEVDALLNEVTR